MTGVFAPGSRLGPYEIVSRLGAGGMGEVFQGLDTRLDRPVAIKTLAAHLARDPEALERFERECRAIAALSHPNVLALYDVGRVGRVPYAVTELLEGEVLRQALTRGPMPWRRAVEVGCGVAGGLSAAHARGVLHRDLKPENVFLTADGQVKILDFGLARLQDAPGASVATLGHTAAGAVMGTFAYMSPEQVRGAPIDATSDIFSFGCLLHEMIAGRPAFGRATLADTAAAIVGEEPAPLGELISDLPSDLEVVARRCLTKDPRQRFQSAADLALVLGAMLSGAGSSRPGRRRTRARGRSKSLAVLPFTNASGDPDAEYLSDGITESVINSLSGLRSLRVVTRSAAFRYKASAADPQQAGRELDVRAVLTGRVLLRGDMLVIAVELVDVANGWQLWGAHYSRKLADVFAVQEDIAQEISAKLELRLTGEEKSRLGRRQTENLDAYQAYLRGRYAWARRTEEAFRKAIEHFQQAIEHDPSYAPAYAGLADAYAVSGMAEYGIQPPSAVMPRARAAAARALELDPSRADAQTCLAHVQAFYDWDWEGAERDFQRAIELNPDYAWAHHWYALLLAALSRHDEAIAAERRAQALEPLAPVINKNVGTILHLARRYDAALEQYRRALDVDGDFPRTHFFRALTWQQTGSFPDAVTALERAMQIAGRNSVMLATLGSTCALAGRRDEAMAILDTLEQRARAQYVPAFTFALVAIGLAEADRAFGWLERALEERSSWLAFLNVDPIFDPLRGDARFAGLVARVGLPA
jgi:eukaryotic-like serine/threonine-protein kinase